MKGAGKGESGNNADTEMPLTTSWGKLLDESATQVQNQAAHAYAQLQQVDPELARKLYTAEVQAILAKGTPEFERDFKDNVDRLNRLTAALETAEQALQNEVGKDAERKAMRTFRKDPVDLKFEHDVAAYYDALAKGGASTEKK